MGQRMAIHVCAGLLLWFTSWGLVVFGSGGMFPQTVESRLH